MNKTAITIGFFVLVALAVIGGIVILIIKPEAIATFTSTIVVILGLATTGAVTFYGLGKQGEKLDTISRQTNGTLSKLHEENTRLTNLLTQRGINPDADTIEARKPAHARE